MSEKSVSEAIEFRLVELGAATIVDAEEERHFLRHLHDPAELLEAQKAFMDRQTVRFGDILSAARRMRSRHLVTAAARLLAEAELDDALEAYERGESEAPRG